MNYEQELRAANLKQGRDGNWYPPTRKDIPSALTHEFLQRQAAEIEADEKTWILLRDGKITGEQADLIDKAVNEWCKDHLITAEKYEAIKLSICEPQKKTKQSVGRSANRIPRSMSRKEAFQTAWKIVKAGGYEIKVVGVTFYNRQEALKRLATYDPKNIHTFFVPEHDNQYDSNAIAVKVLVDGSKNVYRLGYVPKGETAIVKAFLGTAPELKVLDGDICGAKIRIAA
jgi:hypothetical protein